MNGKALEVVGQFKYLESIQSTNERRNISKGSKDQTGAGILNHEKSSNTMEKQSSLFSHNDYTLHLCYHNCSMDMRAGRWRRIWRVESKPLKTNATGGCLAYVSYREHKTNKYRPPYGSRPLSSLDARSFYCQPSRVASSHDSVMSADAIRCRRSYYKEHWMVLVAEEDRVNHGGTILRNGQASRLSYLLRIADDRNRWAVIAAEASARVSQRHLSVTEISVISLWCNYDVHMLTLSLTW